MAEIRARTGSGEGRTCADAAWDVAVRNFRTALERFGTCRTLKGYFPDDPALQGRQNRPTVELNNLFRSTCACTTEYALAATTYRCVLRWCCCRDMIEACIRRLFCFLAAWE